MFPNFDSKYMDRLSSLMTEDGLKSIMSEVISDSLNSENVDSDLETETGDFLEDGFDEYYGEAIVESAFDDDFDMIIENDIDSVIVEDNLENIRNKDNSVSL